jgi:hypothetical protein
MKRLIYNLGLFIFFAIFVSSSCKKEDNPTEPEPPQNETAITVVGSTGSGTVTTPSGYGVQIIPGAVPPNAQGGNANITFSIESPSTPPKSMSSFAQVKSDIFKVGPDGFSFRWPIKVIIPFKNAEANQVHAVYFDPLLDTWKVVPASKIDNTTKKMEIDVLNLGYFAAAVVSQGFPKTNADDADGGFELNGEPGYYYTLTVNSVSNYKYPYQAAWYGNPVGNSGSSGSSPTGGPVQPTHIHLAQATYEIWVSRTIPGTLSTLPKLYTYTIPATGTISQPVIYTGPLSTGSGWTSLGLPGGGSWLEGSPSSWPTPTSSYGTGEFQATLTWVNTSSKSSDVDLHLYGPNNMHVYYDSKNAADGTLQLDRDWQSASGNAVENIYSLKQMTKGSYTIKVNLYAGATTSYSVRIIRGGTVKTYTGTVSTLNSADDSANMITIDSFTL